MSFGIGRAGQRIQIAPRKQPLRYKPVIDVIITRVIRERVGNRAINKKTRSSIVRPSFGRISRTFRIESIFIQSAIPLRRRSFYQFASL